MTGPALQHTPRMPRARALFDRVPTRWLVASGSGILLAASAVFGGLNDAEPVEPPHLEVGEAHAGLEMDVTVNGGVLIDAFPEVNLIPDDGNRLFVVRATVENTTTAARRLSSTEPDPIQVDGVPEVAAGQAPTRILVIDDGSDLVVVQPGVPVELAFIWEIPADALAAGDTVAVSVLDRVYIGEGELTYGGLYGDPAVSATVDLELTDVGAGVTE